MGVKAIHPRIRTTMEGSKLTSVGRSLRPFERLMEDVVTWCTPYRSLSVKKWGAIAHIICTWCIQHVSVPPELHTNSDQFSVD